MSDEIVKKMGKRLIGLSVQRYQRVEAIELDLSDNGQVAFLAGNNEQGKTSTLDAVDALFGGKKQTSEKPVRHGNDESKLVAITDAGFRVERIIKADGTTKKIIISGPDGSTYKKPQELLDAFYNAHTRDALAFINMSGKERVDAYKRVLGIDFAEADAKIEGAKEIRKGHSANLKYAKDRAAIIGEYRTDLPEHPTTTVELINTLNKVHALEKAQHEAGNYIAWADNQISLLEKQLEELRINRKKAIGVIDERNNNVPNISVQELERQISVVDETNRAILQNQECKKIAADIRDLEGKVMRANEVIDKIEAGKKQVLANAKFPVPGIVLGDNDILVNGIPFEQEAKSKRIRISVAIAARLPGQLKTLLIRDASLLDADSLAACKQAIIEEDCQAILEIINPSDAQGLCFVIENGEVKEVRK